MSAKRDVDVYDGSRRVERLSQRPVRLMPNNRAGIVYGGDVYPLHTGDRIDLADAPVKKTSCSGFLAANAAIPYAVGKAKKTASTDAGLHLERWYVESNRFGNYLVFDASLPIAKKVVALMEKAGLGVRRWDESIRESDDGESYDWFIRLKFEGTRDECVNRIRRALGEVGVSAIPPSSNAPAASAELKRLRLEVLELRADKLAERTDALLEKVTADQQIRKLTTDLTTAQKATSKAQAQLTDLQKKHRTDRDKLRRLVSKLEQQLAAPQARPAADVDLEKRLREVLDAKDETEAQYFAAQEAAEAAAERAQRLEDAVDALRAQLEEATTEAQLYREQFEQASAELAETRSAPRERRTAAQAAGGPPQGSVEAFLSRLLPRTELDADSIESLLDWPDPAAAVDFLLRVDGRSEPTRRSLSGKTGWWESPHLNTGRTGKETAGRIYYAPIKEQRVLAVLHEKEDDKEQKRFVAQLPDC